MASALRQHDSIMAKEIQGHDGVLVKPRGEGDSVFGVFERPSDAIRCAVDLQGVLQREPWPAGAELKVRMAIHAGQVEQRSGDYYGPTVNRCARIRGLLHGDQVVVSRVAYTLAQQWLPPQLAVVDLGECRLRDLLEPERLYQVSVAGLREEFRPLKCLDSQPNNLPALYSTFLGRDKETTDLHRRLNTWRLVSVVGIGGMGKTRLVLQVAADEAPSFPDGTWLVDLSATNDEDGILRALADVLKLDTAQSGTQLLEQLQRHFAQEHVLILLDSCERTLVACAEVVQNLLTHCPGLKVLATSTEPMNVPGESLLRLEPLSAPEPGELDVERIEDYGAVQLLSDRARLIDPEFRVTNVAQAVAEICDRLEGIPLAIELAAARLDEFTANEVAARLRYSVNIGSSRTLVSRHRTLDSAIAWSYDLLADEEKHMFRTLAVFEASFGVELVELLASDMTTDVRIALSTLVQKSLVNRETKSGRNRFLEPIRNFALARLAESGDEAAVRDRHLATCRELAMRFNDGKLSADQLPSNPDLDAALRWAARKDNPDLLEARAQLAGALWHSGRVADAIAAQQELIRDRQRVLGPNHRDTLVTRGDLAVSLSGAGRLADAVEAWQALLPNQLSLLPADDEATLLTRGNLAWALLQTGTPDEAIAANQAVLIDDRRVFGDYHPFPLGIRGNIAAALVLADRLPEAIAAYEELLRDQRIHLGADHRDTLSTRNRLADALLRSGRVAESLAAFEELLPDQQRVLGGEKPDTLKTRHGLARALAASSRRTNAISAYQNLLRDQTRILGPEHPDTLRTRDDLRALTEPSSD
jgi:predicted ATPase